jgi:hypothetical protein
MVATSTPTPGFVAIETWFFGSCAFAADYASILPPSRGPRAAGARGAIPK